MARVVKRGCMGCACFAGARKGMSACRHYEIEDGRITEATYERPFGSCGRFRAMPAGLVRHIDETDIRQEG